MKVDLEPCVPPAWAQGGHAQTILGHLLPSPLVLDDEEGQRIEIPVDGGDLLIARFIKGHGDTVLYLFHGLASDISAGYMRRSAAVGRKLGCSVYLVNHRGCGEGRGLARQPYHSGRAEDLAAAIRLGRSRDPEKKHIAVGFSLSANALLLLLSGRRGDTLPDAAIAANGPIDLASAARLLGTGLNRIYDARFSLECRIDVAARRRKGLLQRPIDFPLLTTVRDIDELFTAPEGGFKSREDYYATCSTQDLLKDIKVPTVLLTAEDDPIIDCSRYQAATLSPAVHLHLEKAGGHLGYLTRNKTPLGTNRWLDYALHEYLRQMIQSR